MRESKLTLLKRSFCRKLGDICHRNERIQITTNTMVLEPQILGHLPQKMKESKLPGTRKSGGSQYLDGSHPKWEEDNKATMQQ